MYTLSPQLLSKWQGLTQNLAKYPKVGVALSGGVDSALALCAAVQAVGKQNVAAFTIQSPVEIPDEVQTAQQITNQLGVRHMIIHWNDLDTPGFPANTPERCYLCKQKRLTLIKEQAETLGISMVCDGSNLDDGADFRPGRRALQELGVLSPLAAAGLTKSEVRQLAQWKNLPVWDKPSMPCLTTRIPYGTPIRSEDLIRIAKGEKILTTLGFSPVRLRLHDKIARVEILPDQFYLFLNKREKIINQFEPLGFAYLTLDLIGFRSGSMNEGLNT